MPGAWADSILLIPGYSDQNRLAAYVGTHFHYDFGTLLGYITQVIDHWPPDRTAVTKHFR